MAHDGFTLLEMILSVAILALIGAVGVPVYQTLQSKTDLHAAATQSAHSLRRAQTLALASDSDSPWGVRIQAGSITLFQGSSYASRTVARDELFSISPALTVSGTSEYVFAKFTGDPSVQGSLTFILPNNEQTTLTVNAKGTVNY